MTRLRFLAIPSETTSDFRAGSNDANGQPPERQISDGSGLPCRHCLTDIRRGEPFLILAYRPFPEPQPYAEVGPIFLHADACDRYVEEAEVPPMFLDMAQLLIRGYDNDDRIIYGTGQIVATANLSEATANLLERPQVAYIHVRSASNNCFQCRIERA